MDANAGNILVVDDTEAQRYLLSRALRRAGFQIEEAGTGTQAMELAERKPDLIVLDIHLPDMNGYELYGRLKANPTTARIPIIFTSTILNEGEERIRVLNLGADDCLAQPIYPAELAAKASSLIRARRAEAELQSLLHAVVETIPDAIYAKDAQSRLVLANAAALKIVGKPADQVLGHDDREFYDDPAVADTILENDRRVMANGVVERFEEKLLTPEGYRYFLDTKAPWRDAEGRTVGIIGVARDITDHKRAEEELRHSEDRYHSLFENMIEGFFLAEIICDAAGEPIDYRYLDANPALEPLTGLKREQIVGRTVREVLPGVEENWIRTYGRVALTREPVRMCNFAGPLGRHYETVAYSPRKGQFACFFSDVTDRKRAEVRLRRFYETDLFAILYWTIDGGVIDVNDKFLEMTGYTREDLRAGRLNWSEMTPPEYYAMDEDARRQIRETGVHLPYEKEYIRKDGTRVWGLFAAAAWEDNRNEGVSFIVDVSERKRAEEAVRESEARFRAVLQGSRDVVYRLNMQTGRFEYISPSALEVVGCSAEELMAQNAERALSAIYPDDLPAMMAALARLQETGTAEAEYRQRTKTGEFRWMSNHMSLTRDADGKPLYRHGNIRDITETKLAQDALIRSEKLASVGRMAATIAHEINNPLEAVMNTIFIARLNLGESGKAREALDLADQELRRVAHMVRQTLGFYRESTTPAAMSVNAVVESAIDLLKNKIAVKHANVRRHYEAEVEITGVAGEMRQVFSNLLSNSLDAIESGGSITVSVGRPEVFDSEERVTLTFSDDGMGIRPEALPRIFEPFFTTKDAVGTGLGLWIARQLVERHGGAISVKSSIDGQPRGTTFSIVLPIKNGSFNTPKSNQVPGEATAKAGR
jgi:PAS domain S-box-containing protein